MKKVLLVLAILAIAMTTVFAVEGTGSASNTSLDTKGTSATLEVTLNLTSDLANYVEVGFSSNEVKTTNVGEGTANGVSDATVIKSIALTEANGGDLSNPDGTAYVYWIIKGLSGTTANITLEAGQHLAQESGDPTITWIATAKTSEGDKSTTSYGQSGSASAATVATVISDGSLEVGSAPLKISTVDLLNTTVTQGDYAGTLTIKIASAS